MPEVDPSVPKGRRAKHEAAVAPIQVHQGALGRAEASAIDVRQGAIGAAQARSVTADRTAVGAMLATDVVAGRSFVRAMLARSVRVEQSFVRLLVAGEVRLERATFVGVLFARNVTGEVRALLDWRGAAAFGATFGLVAGLLRRRRPKAERARKR